MHARRTGYPDTHGEEVCAMSCIGHIQRSTFGTPNFWVQDVPRNLWLGAHTPRVPVTVQLRTPTSPVALNVHDPALSVNPVGGDVLPLPGEPPSQTPAKMVRVTG